MDAAHRGIDPTGSTVSAVDDTAPSDASNPGIDERAGDQRAQIQADGPLHDDTEAVHDAAAQGVSGAGVALPHIERIQQSFGPQHDLSAVQAHVDSAAASAAERMGARAFARGEHVAFGASPDLWLAAHEAAHVVQQRAGVQLDRGVGSAGDAYERNADAVANRVVSGETATDLLPPAAGHTGAGSSIQRAVPIVGAVIWGGKAAAATAFDAFIDFAIAAILGLPSPGALDHVTNFLVNLVPYLGELKKAKKVAKLLRLVGKVVEPIQKMKAQKIPGASTLVKNLLREARKLKEALRALELDRAKRAFGQLLGYVREAQVATKLQSQGATIEHLGKNIKRAGNKLTDIDVVSREGQQLVLTQVKAGNAAKLTPESNSWATFSQQAQRTREAAAELVDPASGLVPKVRYIVDDITPEARTFLEGLGFTVELAGSFLK